MTNFEKYRTEIFNICQLDKGIAIIHDKPAVCLCDSDCSACYLLDACTSSSEERKAYKLMEWATSEYEEKPILTKRQHAFCEAFPDKWLVKWNSETLLLLDIKPDINEDGLKNADDIIIDISEELISFHILKEKVPYNTNKMMTWEVKE